MNRMWLTWCHSPEAFSHEVEWGLNPTEVKIDLIIKCSKFVVLHLLDKVSTSRMYFFPKTCPLLFIK